MENNVLLAPWTEWAWLETVPGSTMGSIRATPRRPWHGRRQKAIAGDITEAATAAKEKTSERMVGEPDRSSSL